MKTNLKPAFRYQFNSFIRGSGIIYLILIAIVAISMVGNIYTNGNFFVSFTGYSITIAIFMFVMGIVNIRNDLRLCLQYGVSRRTSFVSEILTVMSAAVILAAAVEVLTVVTQLLTVNNSNLFVADIYQLIYVGTDIPSLSLSQHALSALFNTSLMFAASLGGMFFSLMFWRLSKVWTIIVAVSIPVLINVVPMLLYRIGVDLTPFIRWLTSSPFCFVVFFLLFAALLGIIDWLLLRRANIKEAK